MNCFSSGPGGSFYAIIAAYYPIWSEHCNIFVTAAPGGSVENVKAVSKKECELGVVHHSMPLMASQGKMPYTEVYPGVRSIIGCFSASVQVLTLKGAKLTSIEQFNGSRVGMGILGGTATSSCFSSWRKNTASRPTPSPPPAAP
jgi:TRAP-type uncharacterized transport system substrate-binding protein